MQKSCPGGIGLIRAPAAGQLHCRIPAAQDMGDPVLFQQAHHGLFQHIHGHIAVIPSGMVQIIHLHKGIDTLRQEIIGTAEHQHTPQVCG